MLLGFSNCSKAAATCLSEAMNIHPSLANFNQIASANTTARIGQALDHALLGTRLACLVKLSALPVEVHIFHWNGVKYKLECAECSGLGVASRAIGKIDVLKLNALTVKGHCLKSRSPVG